MQAASELQERSNIVPLTGLDLGVEELGEQLVPGFWETLAGIGAGIVVGGGALAGGIFIGVAIAT